jgi:RNA-directed DNA polymerase
MRRGERQPISDLPSEQYAYRPGRNAQQAVVEVEELLFRGHPEVVDAEDIASRSRSCVHRIPQGLRSVIKSLADLRVQFESNLALLIRYN